MKKLKHIYKSLCSALKDPIKRPFLFRYQNDLFKLSLITMIAVFFVIRGSTALLLIDTKVMRFLFCSDANGDKTLYNISVSVIAAFVFYIFQIYLPERSRSKKRMLLVSAANQHEIFLLEQFMLSWYVFLSIRDGQYWCEYREFSYKSNKEEHSVWKELYEETIDELVDNLDRIIESDVFKELDTSYCEFLVKIRYVIAGHLKFLKDILPVWENYPMELQKIEYEMIQNTIMAFSAISRKLQRIERVSYSPVHIYAYEGKSEIQKLAEKL